MKIVKGFRHQVIRCQVISREFIRIRKMQVLCIAKYWDKWFVIPSLTCKCAALVGRKKSCQRKRHGGAKTSQEKGRKEADTSEFKGNRAYR